MRSVTILMCAGLACAATAGSACANSFTLDLSGLQDREEIQSYFAGGSGGNGSTGGANSGITFSQGATAQTNGANDGFENAPFSNGATAYFNQFTAGADVYLDDPAGFTGGFSFWYSNGSGGTVEVDLYSGVDGTGSLVGSILLPSNNNASDCANPSDSFCDWSIGGIALSQTVESVDFTGANDATLNNLETLFSDITVGSAVPAPEPASLAIFSAGVALLARTRRSKLG